MNTGYVISPSQKKIVKQFEVCEGVQNFMSGDYKNLNIYGIQTIVQAYSKLFSIESALQIP